MTGLGLRIPELESEASRHVREVMQYASGERRIRHPYTKLMAAKLWMFCLRAVAPNAWPGDGVLDLEAKARLTLRPPGILPFMVPAMLPALALVNFSRIGR